MRAATVRCTFHRPLNAAAGNSTSGGPSPGMLDAALRTDSAGVSAASALVGASVAVDKSSCRRVVDVGASVQLFAAAGDKCSCRRVVDVVGASASVQHASARQCSSRIAATSADCCGRDEVQQGRVQTNTGRDQKHEFVELALRLGTVPSVDILALGRRCATRRNGR